MVVGREPQHAARGVPRRHGQLACGPVGGHRQVSDREHVHDEQRDDALPLLPGRSHGDGGGTRVRCRRRGRRLLAWWSRLGRLGRLLWLL